VHVSEALGGCMRIGYIGLGQMGGALARRLQSTFPLNVFDLNSVAVQQLVDAGAQACRTAREVGEHSDVVFTCLQTSEQVETAIFGTEGLAFGLKSGGLIVDQTTGDAHATRRMAARLGESGLELIDAPVSGGPQYAAAGTIAIMAGGSPQQYQRIEPVLKAISPNVFHCGGVGTGHVAKVCNNLMAASQRLLTFEVVALAVKNGLSPEQAVEVMLKSSGRNYTLDVTFRRHILPGELFQGFTLGLMQKDVGLAMQLAASSGVPLFFGGMVRQFYQAIINERGADADVNYAVKVFERLADVNITPATK
jgi:3-hydroxyisobutyrate dehydrogenase